MGLLLLLRLISWLISKRTLTSEILIRIPVRILLELRRMMMLGLRLLLLTELGKVARGRGQRRRLLLIEDGIVLAFDEDRDVSDDTGPLMLLLLGLRLMEMILIVSTRIVGVEILPSGLLVLLVVLLGLLRLIVVGLLVGPLLLRLLVIWVVLLMIVVLLLRMLMLHVLILLLLRILLLTVIFLMLLLLLLLWVLGLLLKVFLYYRILSPGRTALEGGDERLSHVVVGRDGHSR